MPLENFFTEALYLDLTHVPDRPDIAMAHLEAAEAAADVPIELHDTVPPYSGLHDRTADTEGYMTDFPGLTTEDATWLGRKGITAFTFGVRQDRGLAGRRWMGWSLRPSFSGAITPGAAAGFASMNASWA